MARIVADEKTCSASPPAPASAGSAAPSRQALLNTVHLAAIATPTLEVDSASIPAMRDKVLASPTTGSVASLLN